MATKPAEKLGKGPCPNCGEAVTFKRSGGGKVTFTCDADGCDSSGYAEPESGMAKKWIASIVKPRTGPADPAPPAKREAFDLGQL